MPFFLLFVFLFRIVGYTLCNVSFSHTVCHLNRNILLVGLRYNYAVRFSFRVNCVMIVMF